MKALSGRQDEFTVDFKLRSEDKQETVSRSEGTGLFSSSSLQPTMATPPTVAATLL
jgi:hypothetical protein